MNRLLTRLWDAPDTKKNDLGSPMNSAAPQCGALRNDENNRRGVNKHAHVSFNVIEG